MYKGTGYHFGVDFFSAEDQRVYSIADDGLVVGIGTNTIGQIRADKYNRSSQSAWGSAVLDGGIPGYSIIVRYGQLYVLYGHLKVLDDGIYVGARVDAGTPLGYIGQFGTPHTHIEVRVLSDVGIASGSSVFLQNSDGTLNVYGILAYNALSAGFVFDAVQFFSLPGMGRNVISSQSQQIASGTALGDYEFSIYQSNPIPVGCNTERQHTLAAVIFNALQDDPDNPYDGYWGLDLGHGLTSDLPIPFSSDANIPAYEQTGN